MQNGPDGLAAAATGKSRPHQPDQAAQRPARLWISADYGWATEHAKEGGRVLLRGAHFVIEGGGNLWAKGGGHRCADTAAPRGRGCCSGAASPSPSAAAAPCVRRLQWHTGLEQSHAGRGTVRGCGHAWHSEPSGANRSRSGPSACDQRVTPVLTRLSFSKTIISGRLPPQPSYTTFDLKLDAV